MSVFFPYLLLFTVESSALEVHRRLESILKCGITLIFPRFSIGGRGMQVGARADKMSTRMSRIRTIRMVSYLLECFNLMDGKLYIIHSPFLRRCTLDVLG